MITTDNPIIKIIRLQSGEDIIAEYKDDDDILHLSNPMLLMFKRISDGSAMIMLPWLPIELIKNNTASIYYTDVVTILDPEPEVEEYYRNAVNIDLVRIKQNGKIFLKYLLSKIDSNLSQMDDDQEEEIDFDLMDVEDLRKNTYH